ncbi:TEF transcription factor, PAR bZIP family member a isoform X2 [Gadus macrocephalus]|uniref:TEF transcription factor, PAR bZIP family member a isoform X2 n=1 Tax=Gadus macrocephalus TaxID=80720 RepID=UPI0028CB2D17|nr:TEF transcription factor, PAR bZIP family member a isoform X2 [Gadus macrocephalus]
MSGEPITITMETTNSGGLGSLPLVFKKIMDVPPPNLLEGDDDSDKDKLCLDDNLEMGGIDIGPSAALTPAIWDKTIPYDGENFHLEYMDLEEFLLENGIANAAAALDDSDMGSSGECSPKKALKGQAAVTPKCPSSPATLLPTAALDQSEEVVGISELAVESEICIEVSTDEGRLTPDPADIEVDIAFEPDHTDLVLSSVPGGELFNPRKHKFTDEDLKPQPMIKKAKKVLVPEERKDEKYWHRRSKNNVAAKRSRDARRLKENQITVRAAFLERENSVLRSEVVELRKECGRYKTTVTRFQAKYGAL